MVDPGSSVSRGVGGVPGVLESVAGYLEFSSPLTAAGRGIPAAGLPLAAARRAGTTQPVRGHITSTATMGGPMMLAKKSVLTGLATAGMVPFTQQGK